MHNGAHDTEISAERRIAPIAGTLREKVLDWIHEAGDRGITMKEAGARYAVEKGKHPSDGSCRYSVAPRITELAQLGYVKDGGQRRDGCVVWVEAAPGDDPGNMMVVVRRQRAPRPLPQ